MSERPDTSRHSLPTDVELRVNDICDRFESAWRAGEHPRVEDFLSAITEPGRSALVRELVPLDIVYRRKRGYEPTVGDYSSLFPTGAPDWLGDEIAGGRAGRYQLGDELGHGGMGVVFRANDPNLGRELAVKVLPSRDSNNPAARDRFLREATITARLQHPNIPPVHECGQLADGRPFFAMKLIRGRTLNELLSERPTGALDVSRWLPVFLHVCQGVAYAHSQGVIHRDLKPRNIMVGEFGEVQVMDWGLAKVLSDPRTDAGRTASPVAGDTPRLIATPPLGDPRYATTPGQAMGTAPYLPPEQARGEVESLDPRCDVFSLGAVLCEILTGHPPYTSANGPILKQAQTADLEAARGRLAACGADPELVNQCKRCLSPDRDARPADAGAVAARVTAYQKAVEDRLRQAELDRAAAEVRAAEQRKHRRVQLMLAAAVLALVTGGAAVGWWYQRVSDRQKSDLANRRAINAGAVDAALQRALALNELGLTQSNDLKRWKETIDQAYPTLDQAAALLNEDSTDELRARVSEVRRQLDERKADCVFWLGTEEILGEIIEGGGTEQSHKNAARHLERLFRDRGFELTALGRERTVGWLRNHPLRHSLQSLLLFLSYWHPDSAIKLHFLELANAVDPEQRMQAYEWLKAYRAKDAEAFERLSGDPVVNELAPTALVLMGRAMLTRSARETGLRRLKEWQVKHPDSFWLNYQLVVALLDEKDPVLQATRLREALQYAMAAVALRKDSPRAHTTLARAYYLNGHFDGAVRACRAALKHGPSYQPALNMDRYLRTRTPDRNPAPVAPHPREVLAIDRTNPVALIEAANALRQRKWTDQAISLYREAIALEPKNPKAHNFLGIALYDNKDYPAAETSYREAIRLNPMFAYAHANLSFSLRFQKKYLEAIDVAREAVKISPKLAFGHYALGLALQESGDTDEARKAFAEAARLDPKQYGKLVEIVPPHEK